METEKNSNAQLDRHAHGQIQYRGPTFSLKGKRLTKCSCNKPGYRYKTYFEHSNEPPIGPRMLRGIQKGWRYKRHSRKTQRKTKPRDIYGDTRKRSGKTKVFLNAFLSIAPQNRPSTSCL